MKRPSFQFYPADWRKDPGVRVCSLAARGLWIEIICIAHEAEPYGHLVVNGQPMTADQLARTVGESAVAVASCLSELEAAGVFSRDEAGAIVCRRMVKDEAFREVRARCGKMGGNPHLIHPDGGSEVKVDVKVDDKVQPKVHPTPSSSSSSSSSKTKNLRRVEPDGFRRFWQSYPATRRRVAKVKCLAVWVSNNLESSADAIVAHVVAMSPTQQWREGYEPAPLTYLNQRRWEDGLPVGAGAGVALKRPAL
jgi:hypothetical protein